MQNGNWAKFQRFWFPVILYSGIIFYVSSIPNVKTPLQEIQFDKILHILVYIPFGFLIARGIGNSKGMDLRDSGLWIVILVSFLYGLSDEIHQMYVPGRKFGIFDLTADTIGGTIGGYLYTVFLGHIKKR